MLKHVHIIQYPSLLLYVLDSWRLHVVDLSCFPMVQTYGNMANRKKHAAFEFWFELDGSLSSLSMSQQWECPNQGRSFSKTPATRGVNVCTTKLGRDDRTGAEASRKTCPEIWVKPNSSRQPGWPLGISWSVNCLPPCILCQNKSS